MTLARVVHTQLQEQGGEIVPLPEAPGGLEAWGRKAQVAFDVAKALALTPFVPSSLVAKKTDENNKPVIDVETTTGNVLGALLVGDELGLQPMAAMRSIDIITGTPALRAITQRAVVQAAGHEIVVVESTSTRAIVKGKRRGSSEWQQSEWTIDRAKALGLVGKENWRKQPTAMLLARATAECARMVASDALLGMPYAVEELADGEDSIETPQPETTPRRTRTAQRRSAKQAAAASDEGEKPEPGEQPEPEPDFGEDGPPASPDTDAAGSSGNPPRADESAGPAPDPAASTTRADDSAAPDVALATTPQLQKLHILFGELGIADRERGLAFLSELVARPLESSKELTKDEASSVIDGLERRLAAQREREQADDPAEPGFEDVPLPPEPLEETP